MSEANTYVVRLTAQQLRLLRQELSKRSLLVRQGPLPEDGDLLYRLIELDKLLWTVEQCVPSEELFPELYGRV